MPAGIDHEQRLTEIALATLQVAREEGAHAVTIRAVAARMGGSTTLVTKFVPSRAALLANAFQHMQAVWAHDVDEALGATTDMERLRALITWMFGTVGYDQSVRRLWIESIALDTENAAEHLQEAHDEFEIFKGALEASPFAGHADWLTDLLFLAARGYYISSVEDPARWSSTRAANSIGRLVDLMERVVDQSQPTTAVGKSRRNGSTRRPQGAPRGKRSAAKRPS